MRPCPTPRVAGLRHGAELAADLRVHPRGARPRRPAPADDRRREQHEHARGDGPVRRATAARSGPARTSIPGPPARRPSWSPAARARRIFELGGDWVAITSPARFLLDPRASSRTSSAAIAHIGMLSDWVLYRLTGRFVTDPSAGSSSDLFDLARPVVVAGAARPRRPVAGRSCPRCSSRAPWSGRSRPGPPTRPGSRRARRSSSAAPTPSSGWSASAS